MRYAHEDDNLVGRDSMTFHQEDFRVSKLMVFSGNANPELAHKIIDRLDIPLGDASVSKFSDGEITVGARKRSRKDVFIISFCSPTNDNLLELLLADSLRRASASRITAVIPLWLCEQDRRVRSARVPISAKVIADMVMAWASTAF